jgi:hypothetical protein
VQGVFGGSASLLEQATSALGNVAPYHWLDFINNRALYAGIDVGNVTQATGYSFTRASDGYYTNSDGTLTLFGSGALRRGDRGVLIEGSRTNLCLQSQTLETTWSVNQTVVTSNDAAAPDGTTTADKLAEDTSTNVHSLAQSIAVTNATSYVGSYFVKNIDRRYVQILFGSGGHGSNAYANFDLQAGTVGTVGSAVTSSGITALTNGWYRIWIAAPATATTTGSTQLALIQSSTAARAESFLGTSKAVHIWGAQLEAASFPSSYIPTVAASATRAADVLSYTAGVSYGLSLWAEFERAVDTGATETFLQIDNGGNSNAALICVSAADVAQVFQVTSSVAVAQPSVAGALAINTAYKVAGRYGLDSVQIARGGTLGTEDTSASEPPSPTVLRVGSASSFQVSFGYIRRAAVFNSALTDAQLQTVST